jgi:hypothetical protein
MTISVSLQGSPGIQGLRGGLVYYFSNNIDEESLPGQSYLKYNSTILANVTSIYISNYDNSIVDHYNYYSTIDYGYLIIHQINTNVFRITDVDIFETYTKFTVTHLSGNVLPTNGNITVINIFKDGDKGDQGDAGTAFVYMAYASDASGTGFTTTFNSSLDYIAIKVTAVEIVTPTVDDFTGLWKKYKGEQGPPGSMDPSYNLSDVSDAATSFNNIKQDATTDYSGTSERATDIETIAGASTNTTISPSNLAAKIDIDSTFSANSDNLISSQKAVKTALALKAPLISPSFTTPTLGVASATSINELTLTKQTTGFTLAGGTTSKTLTVDETESLSNKVKGPASSLDNAIVRYDSTTGKLVKDSLATIDNNGSTNIPTGQTYNINNSPHTHSYMTQEDVLKLVIALGGL